MNQLWVWSTAVQATSLLMISVFSSCWDRAAPRKALGCMGGVSMTTLDATLVQGLRATRR